MVVWVLQRESFALEFKEFYGLRSCSRSMMTMEWRRDEMSVADVNCLKK